MSDEDRDARSVEAFAAFLHGSQTAAPHDVARLVQTCAVALGARSGVVHLVDLQQHVLVPVLDGATPAEGGEVEPLSIDATLAGRAYQSSAVLLQDVDGDDPRVWLPLLSGVDRLGVLGASVSAADQGDEWLLEELRKLALEAASLVITKAAYGDALVQLRRRAPMGLAAEIQYSLLPPLTFASPPVSVTAALEPCYKVAGDTIDYAVDAGVTRVAVFDGMGHGLHSAQCAVLTVAAYRNCRRAGLGLTETLKDIDAALLDGLGGEVFSTAVLAELDTVSGAFSWVNAGHPEPLLIRGGRLVKTLSAPPRPPLGLGYLLDTDAATVGTEQLEPGDQVLLYTDGVVEARSPDGEFFGAERLAELVVRHLAGGLPAPETVRRVVRELLAHHQDELTDDASMLLLGWRADSTS